MTDQIIGWRKFGIAITSIVAGTGATLVAMLTPNTPAEMSVIAQDILTNYYIFIGSVTATLFGVNVLAKKIDPKELNGNV